MEKKLYILLSATGTKFSRFLRFASKRYYTHVSISLDKEFTELYSFGRRNLLLPFIAGFVKENPSGGVFAKYPTECIVYELVVSKEEYDEVVIGLEKFKNEYSRYRYNFLGLPLIVFNIPLQRKNHYVCSQFVAYLLSESGVVEFKKHSSLVRPDDFTKIDKCTQIFKGSLIKYLLKKK